MDIRNLGDFESIEAVWVRYPEGGIEGDYLFVGDVKYRWNKYALLWENALTVTETPARREHTFDGDVTVEHNLTVVGEIRAKRLSFEERLLGLYTSSADLISAHPTASVGAYAYVGSDFPVAVWSYDKTGWSDTGGKYSGESVDIREYAEGVVDEIIGGSGIDLLYDVV